MNSILFVFLFFNEISGRLRYHFDVVYPLYFLMNVYEFIYFFHSLTDWTWISKHTEIIQSKKVSGIKQSLAFVKYLLILGFILLFCFLF